MHLVRDSNVFEPANRGVLQVASPGGDGVGDIYFTRMSAFL